VVLLRRQFNLELAAHPVPVHGRLRRDNAVAAQIVLKNEVLTPAIQG
jgi:hypothetical protein